MRPNRLLLLALSPNSPRHSPGPASGFGAFKRKEVAREGYVNRSQYLVRGPTTGSSACCRSWRTLSVSLGEQSASSFARLHECHAECLMRKRTLACPPGCCALGGVTSVPLAACSFATNHSECAVRRSGGQPTCCVELQAVPITSNCCNKHCSMYLLKAAMRASRLHVRADRGGSVKCLFYRRVSFSGFAMRRTV